MSNKILIFVLVLSAVAVGAGCKTNPESQTTLTTSRDEAYSLTTQEETNPDPNMHAAQEWSYPGQLPANRIENKQVRVVTDKGEIVFELLPEVAPITVSNFVYLAEGGYYDGLTFHRREENFVIQGGDPLGNGMGGPGYTIPDEFNETSHERGVVAMAKTSAPNSAGSQFYITLAPATFLDGNYTVFGRVLSGMEVVDQIQVGDVMTKITVENKP